MTANTDNSTPLLRNKSFVAYFSAAFVTSFGSSLVDSIWPIIAYWLTESPFVTGLTVLAQVGPHICLGLVAGAHVDRAKSKKVFLIVPNLVSAIAYGAAAIFGASTITSLVIAMVCYTVSETAVLYFDTAVPAVLPLLIGRSRIASARSSMAIVLQLMGFVTPGFAVLIFEKTGARPLFLINAVCFVLAAFLLSKIVIPATPQTEEEQAERRRLWPEIVSGFHYLWANAPVRVLTLVGTLNAFVGGLVAALYLSLADEQYGIGAYDPTAAFFIYAMLVGAIGGNVILPRLRKAEVSPLLVAAVSLLVNAVALGFMASGHSPWQFLVALMFWQSSYGLIITNAIVLRMEIVEEKFLGRVSATARLISWGASPVGAIIAGAIAQSESVSASQLFWYSVILPVLGSGYLLFFHRKLHGRKLHGAPHTD